MLRESPLPRGTGWVIIDPVLEVSLPELSQKLGKAQQNAFLLEAAARVLALAVPLWHPKIVYRWLDVEIKEENKVSLSCDLTGETSILDLGHSVQFIKDAEKALVGIYTVGSELENAVKKASGQGLVVDAYLFDIVGLAVLGKLGQQVNRVVQDYARKQHWGVGPLLSPGSVHGWQLEDSHNLYRLLPIEAIEVKMSPNGILLPFKSLSFLIGTGPGYQASEVGTSCAVCSKRDNCEIRKNDL
jgi:hypothetical protein